MEGEDTRQFRRWAIKTARPCRRDPFSAGGHPVVLIGELVYTVNERESRTGYVLLLKKCFEGCPCERKINYNL